MGVFRLYAQAFQGLSRETWMLSVVMLINRTGSMVLPFLGVYMTDKLGFSLIHVGWVLGSFGVGSVIGSFLGGYLTDKFGEFRVQAMSLFAAAPLFLLIPLFKTVPGMMGMIFVLSLVAEFFRPANLVAVTRYARPGTLTRAFSLNRIANNIGFAFGPALGGILSALSYEFLFATNALAFLVAGFVYLRFFKYRSRLFKLRAVRRERLVTQVLDVQKNPYLDAKFLLFTAFCTLFTICFYQYVNTLPLFYQEIIGLKQQTIGLVLGYNGFLIAVFEMSVVNWAEKRFTLSTVVLIGCLLGAVSFSLLFLDPRLGTVVIAMTVMSIGEIFVVPFMSTITAIRSGSKSMGAYMGLNGMSFSVAFIVTPILGTMVAGDFGFGTLWLATATGLLMAGFALYWATHRMFPGKKAVDA